MSESQLTSAATTAIIATQGMTTDRDMTVEADLAGLAGALVTVSLGLVPLICGP